MSFDESMHFLSAILTVQINLWSYFSEVVGETVVVVCVVVSIVSHCRGVVEGLHRGNHKAEQRFLHERSRCDYLMNMEIILYWLFFMVVTCHKALVSEEKK